MAVNCSTGFRSRLLGPYSIESIFDGGCIEVYSGAQPSSANMAPTGTLLARISNNGLPWNNGSAVNGLLFARTGARMTNHPAQLWGLQGIATGAAGWARLRPISDSGGLSDSAPRIDMAVGLVGAAGDFQLRLPTLDMTASIAIPITSWWFVFPPID